MKSYSFLALVWLDKNSGVYENHLLPDFFSTQFCSPWCNGLSYFRREAVMFVANGGSVYFSRDLMACRRKPRIKNSQRLSLFQRNQYL